MAKRKKTKRRRNRRAGAAIRRRLPKKVRILPTLALGATQLSNLGNPNVHINGPLGGFVQNAQAGNYVKATRDLIRDEIAQFTGFDINAVQGSWEFPKATALLIAGGLASKYLGKYINPSFKGIPMIGKKIAF